MLTDAAVIFAIGHVAGIVQFVFDAPVISVVGEQLMFVGYRVRKAGDSADHLDAFFIVDHAGTSNFEHLFGEGKIDLCATKRSRNEAARIVTSVRFFNRAMGCGKKSARRGPRQSVCADPSDYLLP